MFQLLNVELCHAMRMLHSTNHSRHVCLSELANHYGNMLFFVLHRIVDQAQLRRHRMNNDATCKTITFTKKIVRSVLICTLASIISSSAVILMLMTKNFLLLSTPATATCGSLHPVVPSQVAKVPPGKKKPKRSHHSTLTAQLGTRPAGGFRKCATRFMRSMRSFVLIRVVINCLGATGGDHQAAAKAGVGPRTGSKLIF